MRRGGRRFSRRASGGAIWSPAAFGSNLKVWVKGDDAGRSLNTGTNPYQIASYPNQGTIGGVLSQATAADQPLLSTVGGRTASYADGACVLQSDQAATNFKFLHDGTGCTLVFLVEVTGVTGTAIATCTSAGTGIYAQSTASTITVDVRNAGASAVAASASASLGLHVVTFIMSSGSYSLQVDDGTPSTGTPGALSSSDPTTTLLQYAQTAAKVSPFTGALPEFFAVNRVLSAGEIAQAKAYLTTRWLSNWSEAATPWPQLWLDASDTSSVIVTGSGISDWASKSGIAIVGKQATDAKRPVYTSGQYATLDGSDDFLAFTGFHQASGKRTVVAAITPNVIGAGSLYLLDATPAARLIVTSNVTNGLAHFDGAWKSVAANSNALQVAAWQLDSATVSTHRRDGSSLGTVTYTDRAISSSIALGDVSSGAGTNNWPGRVHEFLIFQPALTLTQLQAVESYLQAKWGTP